MTNRQLLLVLVGLEIPTFVLRWWRYFTERKLKKLRIAKFHEAMNNGHPVPLHNAAVIDFGSRHKPSSNDL